MDMSMTTTSMTASITASAAHATASMSMDMGSKSSCKISMLWNWYTVDTCFIASSWHVTSKGMFAGSCIGVILLVMALELLRRGQREFDRYLRRVNAVVVSDSRGDNGSTNLDFKGSTPSCDRVVRVDRLKLWQQLIRAALFTLQFAVGYFVMLLAMYYNGYFIICIFIGAFLGSTLFQWDTFANGDGPETRDSCCN